MPAASSTRFGAYWCVELYVVGALWLLWFLSDREHGDILGHTEYRVCTAKRRADCGLT